MLLQGFELFLACGATASVFGGGGVPSGVSTAASITLPAPGWFEPRSREEQEGALVSGFYDNFGCAQPTRPSRSRLGGLASSILLKGWDRGHAAMTPVRRAASRRKARFSNSVSSQIGLRPPMLTRHGDTSFVDHMGFDTARPQPPRQPEAYLGQPRRATTIRLTVRPALVASSRQRCSSPSKTPSPATASFFSGWRLTPGMIPATSQLDWLISITAINVLSWSRAASDLLHGHSTVAWGTPSVVTATMVPCPRRSPHSVSRPTPCAPISCGCGSPRWPMC